MSIKEELRQYICTELIEEDSIINDHDNLLADGMVDSMGMLRLAAFIDEAWSLRVPPEDFTIENFRTIADLENYLKSRLDLQGTENHAS